jgi:hypothetical protein
MSVLVPRVSWFLSFHQEAMTEQVGRDSSTDMQYRKFIDNSPAACNNAPRLAKIFSSWAKHKQRAYLTEFKKCRK